MAANQAYRWREQTRETLSALLPGGLVILPIGATEQHGPHLATATDALMAETVATRAADRAASGDCPRPLIVAPTLAFGASDHHLPYGGTLSLRPETLLDVVLDLARSIHACGGRRLLIVNGHGGNRGICSAAVAAAPTRYEGLACAYLDYWSLAPAAPHVPGHAGAFETSLALAVEPGLVHDPAVREDPPNQPAVETVEIGSAESWSVIDGFTDSPGSARADDGERLLEHMIDGLASRLVALAGQL